MTDRRREPLPEGYQFGDARFDWIAFTKVKYGNDSLVDRYDHVVDGLESWNVIEGEPFTTDRDPGDETPWAV